MIAMGIQKDQQRKKILRKTNSSKSMIIMGRQKKQQSKNKILHNENHNTKFLPLTYMMGIEIPNDTLHHFDMVNPITNKNNSAIQSTARNILNLTGHIHLAFKIPINVVFLRTFEQISLQNLNQCYFRLSGRCSLKLIKL